MTDQRAETITVLNSLGRNLPTNATHAEVYSWESVHALVLELDRVRRERIDGEVRALAEEGLIPQGSVENFVNRAMRDQTLINDLKAMSKGASERP